MPRTSTVARRYAEAYFALAKDAAAIPEWRTQLAAVTDALTQPELESALLNPRLSIGERTRLGMEVLEGVAPPARNLARLLIERRRTHALPEVLSHYDRLADGEAGLVRAEVTAAIPLDRSTERGLADTLQNALGRPVQMTVRSDPDIIGGLVIRIGDRVIDDSVRTHLQQLQAALA